MSEFEVKITTIKDEWKYNKKEETKEVIRTVKLENESKSCVLTLKAKKENHVLKELSKSDINSEATVVLTFDNSQQKIDKYK